MFVLRIRLSFEALDSKSLAIFIKELKCNVKSLTNHLSSFRGLSGKKKVVLETGYWKQRRLEFFVASQSWALKQWFLSGAPLPDFFWHYFKNCILGQ